MKDLGYNDSFIPSILITGMVIGEFYKPIFSASSDREHIDIMLQALP